MRFFNANTHCIKLWGIDSNR